MNRRFSQYNSGTGSDQTSSICLRPFSIAALVTGVSNDRCVHMGIEQSLKLKRNQLQDEGYLMRGTASTWSGR